MAKIKPTEPETALPETQPEFLPPRGKSVMTPQTEDAADKELLLEGFELIYRCAHVLLKAASPTKAQCFRYLDKLRSRLGEDGAKAEDSWR